MRQSVQYFACRPQSSPSSWRAAEVLVDATRFQFHSIELYVLTIDTGSHRLRTVRHEHAKVDGIRRRSAAAAAAAAQHDTTIVDTESHLDYARYVMNMQRWMV